ncbi:hypothetical protein [Cryptosporangium sp. NPDC051539]|uniref:hypothetical protein n=1 Tax=Cryptosporangium sp. NPDC051539 TaxID=3363962 RepID=UPI00378EC55D
MTQPASLIDATANTAVKAASLALLVQDRLVLIANAKTGAPVPVDQRAVDLSDRPIEALIGQRLDQVRSANRGSQGSSVSRKAQEAFSEIITAATVASERESKEVTR